jgi:DNA-binding HxlR family transcriptional regulator
MKRSNFSEMSCSIARTLDLIGEWWTPLIIRDLLIGNRRFDGLRKNLGISKKILADRLQSLLASGIIVKRLYEQSPPRHEYVLTEKGEELGPILLAMLSWGDKWLSGGKPPLKVMHRDCGHTLKTRVVCTACGEPVSFSNITAEPGPGMSKEQAALWLAFKNEISTKD